MRGQERPCGSRLTSGKVRQTLGSMGSSNNVTVVLEGVIMNQGQMAVKRQSEIDVQNCFGI